MPRIEQVAADSIWTELGFPEGLTLIVQEDEAFWDCKFEPSKPYIEELDSKGGVLSAYQKVSEYLGANILEPSAEIRAKFENAPFGDCIKILPIPLVLERQEYARIRVGVAQVVKALSAFFEDVVLGEKRALSPDGFMPADVVQAIMECSYYGSLEVLQKNWEGKTAKDIAFTVGPDLLRGPDGVWRISEINIGPVGGLADNHFIHQLFKEAYGVPAQSFAEFKFAADDFNSLHQAILDRSPPDRAVIIEKASGSKAEDSVDTTTLDLEDRRREALLSKLMNGLGRKASFEDDLATNIIDHHFAPIIFDSGHESEVKDAVFKGSGATFLNAPGANTLLGAKHLLPYLPQMIKFYLGESAALEIIPSTLVKPVTIVEPPYIALKLPYTTPDTTLSLNCLAGNVLKFPFSDGGGGVMLIDSENAAWASVQLQLLVQDPRFERFKIFIHQPYITASKLAGFSVDLRPIAQALGDGELYVSELPWGRAIQQSPKVTSDEPDSFLDTFRNSRKTNVSLHASELVVLLA